MLTPQQITALRDRAGQIMDPIVDYLIADIAERVSEAGQLTSTAAYQAWTARKMGVSQKELKKELQKRLKMTSGEINQLFKQAAHVGYANDIQRLGENGALSFEENTTLQQILDTSAKMAGEDFENITQTMGFVGPDGQFRELTDAYQRSCDFAFEKVVTGAQDYNGAVRDATRELAKKGIRVLDYTSGVHTSLEAAVRRNIMGGLGLMNEQITQHNHDALGADGWEISAHGGSAPDHEPYQGKQYSDEEYTRLNNSLVRRIGTLNCGHSAMPIILGVNEPQYTKAELEEFRQQNEEGVTYEGKHYTLYEATQRQRKLESSIRNRKRRILIDEKLGDKDALQTDQIRLQVLRQEYSRFSKAADLPMQHARMEVAGFDWKKGKAAEKRYTERVADVGAAAAAQNWHTIPVAGGKTDTKYRRIKQSVDADIDHTDVANKRINENIAKTNPGYSSGNPAYAQNCQRCVAAYEMRRRGYDVIARPAIVDNEGNLSSEDPLTKSWKEIFEGATFLPYTDYEGGRASIIAQMAEWGEGSVAEVKVIWKKGGAHVFVAQHVNGSVRFIDPQNGNTNCEDYFTNAVIGGTMMARIDTLQPTDLIEKCIKNRGGKA